MPPTLPKRSNSLGTSAARALYRDELVAYLQDHRDALDGH